MTKLDDIKVDIFWYKDGWLVEVVVLSNEFEAWLYHKDYDIKELIVGVSEPEISYEEFIEQVKEELETGTYLDDYESEYMY